MTGATKRIEVRAGDVFRIPFGPDEHAYGQVVDQKGPQNLVVVFRATDTTAEEALRSGIELAAIVFDAKFRNGDWPIVSNVLPVKVAEPWFVLGHEGLENLRLENFDGSKTQMVRPAAAAKHGHRSLSYPMALQMAVEAVHGRREWIPEMDGYRSLAKELGGTPAA
jgi:hypothetical protein